jgi:uncharacterized protein (DUF2336 family)
VESSERLDRVERILDDMAARQRYHDEAFDRMDAEIKALKEVSAESTQNILRLARIAEIHHERLARLEGEQPGQ